MGLTMCTSEPKILPPPEVGVARGTVPEGEARSRSASHRHRYGRLLLGEPLHSHSYGRLLLSPAPPTGTSTVTAVLPKLVSPPGPPASTSASALASINQNQFPLRGSHGQGPPFIVIAMGGCC